MEETICQRTSSCRHFCQVARRKTRQGEKAVQIDCAVQKTRQRGGGTDATVQLVSVTAAAHSPRSFFLATRRRGRLLLLMANVDRKIGSVPGKRRLQNASGLQSAGGCSLTKWLGSLSCEVLYISLSLSTEMADTFSRLWRQCYLSSIVCHTSPRLHVVHVPIEE